MRRRRRNESGFALLLVFLMASVIAITLYLEIPRVAFDAQRQKEQLLIDRGEQYKRAIKVFFNTNKRYPASLQELESMNNRRYLRKRYIDPMTGKDEWRVIHIQNGMLTDSKVVQPQKGANNQQTASTAGQYVGEQVGLGQMPVAGAGGGVNLAQRRRASDDRPAGLGDAGGGAGAPQVINPNDPNNPAGQQTGQPTGQQAGNVPVGQLPPGSNVPGIPGMPGQGGGSPLGGGRFPGQINAPGQNAGSQSGSYVSGGGSYVGGGGSYVGGGSVVGSQPNAPGVPGPYPGAPVNSQTGGAAPVYGTAPGANGVPPNYAQPGMNPQGQNAAVGMIQSILTTPRPVGGPASTNGPQMGPTIGGGIAGFASVADQEGIKVYGERTNYGEWEFVFDLNKDNMPLANPVTGAVGTPASQLGNTQGMSNQGMNPVQQPGATPQFPGMPGMPGMPSGGGRKQ